MQKHYRELVPKWHGHPPPEQRLFGAMLAGPLLIIGILWLGWTGNYPSVHWAVPAVATIVVGMSFTLVFISFLSYLIEVYLMYSGRYSKGPALDPVLTRRLVNSICLGGQHHSTFSRRRCISTVHFSNVSDFGEYRRFGPVDLSNRFHVAL